MRGSITSSIVVDGSERDVRVLYQYHKGYSGSCCEPAEPASVEIIEITPADQSITVPEDYFEDERLIAECFEDVAAEAEAAAEWRASRCDDLMGGC